ncbi:hypothetical protein ACWEOI_19265 [Nocardia sp. NPDC004340]
MAEQSFSSFAVDAAELLRLPGSGRTDLLDAARSPLIGDLLAGRLADDADSLYTGMLPALASRLGTPVGAATLPGRHWDDLTGLFEALGRPALAALWRDRWPWPRRTPDNQPWPFPTLAPNATLATLQRELATLAPESLDGQHLPLDEDDLEEAVWLLTEQLPTWVDGARTLGRDLLIVRDGAR